MAAKGDAGALNRAAQEIDRQALAAFVKLVEDIRGGTPPRDAVDAAFQSFTGPYVESLRAGLAVILQESAGEALGVGMEVAGVSLSQRLYAERTALGQTVTGIVDRHARGFSDARTLALDLYEGYRFRPAGEEPLAMKRGNPKLPKYLREALLSDRSMEGEMARAFARLQVADLQTPALRVAYTEALDALEEMEGKGAGRELLNKRLKVAFYERLRYFANRIAQTELHRAYARARAKRDAENRGIEFVQWRLSVTHPRADICDYFAGADHYGLGAGVYPKLLAPVPPAHPFCRCILAPRLDLRGRKPREAADPASFFRSLDTAQAARIAGSRAKLEAVLQGAHPLGVLNAGKDEAVRVPLVGELG